MSSDETTSKFIYCLVGEHEEMTERQWDAIFEEWKSRKRQGVSAMLEDAEVREIMRRIPKMPGDLAIQTVDSGKVLEMDLFDIDDELGQ